LNNIVEKIADLHLSLFGLGVYTSLALPKSFIFLW